MYYSEMNKDYICSLPGDGGMAKCHIPEVSAYHLPLYQGAQSSNCTPLGLYGNTNYSDIDINNDTSTCINWNQYYSVCKAGVNNPFQGAISFDNIGLAWVAIFQVGLLVRVNVFKIWGF